MKRFEFSKKDLTIVQGFWSLPQMVHRTEVAPGSSVSGELALEFRADPLSVVMDIPIFAQVDWFYTPHRLVFPEFVDFIGGDDDDATVIPTTTVDFPAVLDHDATACPTGKHSALARRAFKLAWDEYFGNSEMGTAYGNIDYDTVVDLFPMRTVSQAESLAVLDASIDTPTYDATTVPIDLLDFQEQLRRANASMRRNISSGDRYVDAIKDMGVQLDWRLQMAPEHLGRSKGMFAPRLESATDGANLGKGASRYEFNMRANFKRKRFAEHGLIFAVLTVRPMWAVSYGGHPPDGMMQTKDDFWRGMDYVGEWRAVSEQVFSGAAVQTAYLPPFWQYRYGRNMGESYLAGYGQLGWPTNMQNAWAPDFDLAALKVGEITNDFHVVANARLDGATPVPPLGRV